MPTPCDGLAIAGEHPLPILALMMRAAGKQGQCNSPCPCTVTLTCHKMWGVAQVVVGKDYYMPTPCDGMVVEIATDGHKLQLHAAATWSTCYHMPMTGSVC